MDDTFKKAQVMIYSIWEEYCLLTDQEMPVPAHRTSFHITIQIFMTRVDILLETDSLQVRTLFIELLPPTFNSSQISLDNFS